MAVTIESEIWQPSRWFYAFIFCACAAVSYARIHVLGRRSSTAGKASSPIYADSFALTLPSSVTLFQRRFLWPYLAAAAAEALHSVHGEAFFQRHGILREHIALLFGFAHLCALVLGSLLGLFSDFTGRKRASLICCNLYIIGFVAKLFSNHQCILIGLISATTASFLLSCTFEAWLVAEHEKLGFRQDWLNDTFWKIAYTGGASAIGSAAVANALVHGTGKHGINLSFLAGCFCAVLCILLIANGWEENFSFFKFKAPKSSIFAYYLAVKDFIDKKILLLSWAQACIDFAVAIFWVLWAPTIIADGREVNLNMVYPCFIGFRMLGSLAVSWLLCGPYHKRPEAYLTATFAIASFSLAIPAYDYQEVGVLVALFCIFHFCVGIISPSLARLRSIYIPTDFRAGVICLSHIPASIAVAFVITMGGFNHKLENSTIFTLAVLGLISAASSMHCLNRWYSHANVKVILERP